VILSRPVPPQAGHKSSVEASREVFMLIQC